MRNQRLEEQALENFKGENMATAQRTVNYSVELDSLLVIVESIVRDVVAKKPIGEVIGSAFPALLTALSQIQALQDELKDKKTVEETIGFRAGELVSVVTGA